MILIKKRKEKFIILNPRNYSDNLPLTERSALVEYIESPNKNFYVLQADVYRLNDKVRYGYFKFKSDVFFNPFNPETFTEIYPAHYKEQQKLKRNSKKHFKHSPTLFGHTSKIDMIKRLKLPSEQYKQIIKKESEFTKNKQENEIIPENRPLDTSIEPKELILSDDNKSRLVIYCEDNRRNRLMFLDIASRWIKQSLTEEEFQMLEESRSEGDRQLRSNLSLYPKVI